MPSPRVLLIEFNELAPGLIDRFIDSGHLPNFSRLRDRSSCFVTDASEEVTLEPWTQWPTLHSGLPDTVHGIDQLGQADLLAGRGLARELTAAGHRVGVFGSMNIDSVSVNGGFFVPDPWSRGRCEPGSLQDYYEFAASAIEEDSGEDLRRGLRTRLGKFVLGRGLRPRTRSAMLRQLRREKRKPGRAWRRAMVLDRMNYDVFRHLVKRHDVTFATFFSNTTAHYQHHYWHHLEPDLFSTPAPAETEDRTRNDAIQAGYQSMDRLLGRIFKDFSGWSLVLATGLSQQPSDSPGESLAPEQDVRSGRHHTDGVLWITSSTPNPDAGRIPLTAVAPTILSMFGLDRPAYMAEEPVAVS